MKREERPPKLGLEQNRTDVGGQLPLAFGEVWRPDVMVAINRQVVELAQTSKWPDVCLKCTGGR